MRKSGKRGEDRGERARERGEGERVSGGREREGRRNSSEEDGEE